MFFLVKRPKLLEKCTALALAPKLSQGRVQRTSCKNTEITKALAMLPSHERDAVRLVICEGLSYEEASASLGVPVSTVNNWKYRGINKLKKHAEEAEMKQTA